MQESLASPIAWISYWPIVIAAWVAYRTVRNWITHRSGRFSWTETFLLLFIIFAGGGIMAAAHLSAGLGRSLGLTTSLDTWTVTGNTYAYTETVEADLSSDDAALNVEIFNLYGDVEIHERPGSRLTLVVHKTIRASSSEEADRLNAEFSFRVKQGSGGTVVRSDLDDGVRPAPREWFRSSMTLWVPPETRAHVVNRWGDVIVSGVLAVETDIQHGTLRRPDWNWGNPPIPNP